jgi:hypothetical protein
MDHPRDSIETRTIIPSADAGGTDLIMFAMTKFSESQWLERSGRGSFEEPTGAHSQPMMPRW